MLELFEPASAVGLEVTIVVAHRCSEELCFLSDDVVGERQTRFLVVSRPVDERSLDVGEFAFRPFYG